MENFDWNVDRSAWDKIVITYDKKLDVGEWITLTIVFPKDYFEFDHDRQASLLWHINTKQSVSGYSSSWFSLSDLFFNSDFVSSILTFFIIIVWMFVMPNKWWGGWNYSSWGSYSSSSWFSSGSSYSGWFSSGWWGGWGGSRSW